MRSMVVGACGAEASRESAGPFHRAIGAVPLPRFAGQDKETE